MFSFLKAYSAAAFQKASIGKELGVFDPYENNCLDYVTDVMKAGGIDVPHTRSQPSVNSIKVYKNYK